MPGDEKIVELGAGKGYLLEREARGVLVFHAWWGLNDFFKRVCGRLAEEGFSVLALDLYHGQSATDIESAKRLRQSFDRQSANEEIKAAVAYLRGRMEKNIGVMGFSMGVNLALWTMGNCFKDVSAAVLYYGTSGGRFRRARSSVLGHFAEHDPYVRPEQIAALKAHLRARNVPTAFYVYPGTQHWFMEDDRPEYNPQAAKLAWERTIEFLNISL